MQRPAALGGTVAALNPGAGLLAGVGARAPGLTASLPAVAVSSREAAARLSAEDTSRDAPALPGAGACSGGAAPKPFTRSAPG